MKNKNRLDLNIPTNTHSLTLVDGLTFHLTANQKIPNIFHRVMLRVFFGIKIEIL